MPIEHFNTEEYFRGELINWDAIRKAQSYRESRWRTWLRKLKSWFTTTPRPGGFRATWNSNSVG